MRSSSSRSRARCGRDGETERAVERYVAALEIDRGFRRGADQPRHPVWSAGPSPHRGGAPLPRAGGSPRPVERPRPLQPGRGALTAAELDRTCDRHEFEATLALEPTHRNALYALAVQWNRKGDVARASLYHQRYQGAVSTELRSAPGAGERSKRMRAPTAPLRDKLPHHGRRSRSAGLPLPWRPRRRKLASRHRPREPQIGLSRCPAAAPPVSGTLQAGLELRRPRAPSPRTWRAVTSVQTARGRPGTGRRSRACARSSNNRYAARRLPAAPRSCRR